MNIKKIITILALCSVQAYGQCNECPVGEVPGAGTVTANYTMRYYISNGNGCDLILCSRVDLNGTETTDGTQTYDGVTVFVEGQILLPDDPCCLALASTTTPVIGTILATYDAKSGEGIALVDYWVDGAPQNGVFTIVGPDGASCTSFTSTQTIFDEESQTIETISITFTGGDCEGGAPDPPDTPGSGDPPDRPVDPDPPIDPDDPDPPIDPDDDPDEPDPPIPPDDPNPDDPPDPPTNDECCAAITTRLDILIQYLIRQNNIGIQHTGLLSAINSELNDLYSGLITSDNAMLPYMQHRLHGIEVGVNDLIIDQREAIANQNYEIVLAEAAWSRDFERNFYLGQILAHLRLITGFDDDPNADPVIPTAIDEPADYIIAQPTTLINTMRTNFRTSLTEHGKELTIVTQLDAYVAGEPTAPVWSHDASFNLFGRSYTFSFHLDFDKFSLIRNLFWAAVIAMESLSAVMIVWEEMRKH